MSKAGQSNFLGINYQTWAAFYLFLNHVNDGGFNSIVLEDAKWEDFTLTYVNGKRVICEAKYRSKPLQPNLLKQILQNIINSKDSLGDSDEILIITPTVSKSLADNIKYISWSEEIKDWFKTQKDFSEEQLALLPRVSFYTPASAEFLYKESVAYFYNIRGLSYSWIPEPEVERWLKAIVADYFYKGAEKGEDFSRSKLSEEIDKYFKEKIEINGTYDIEQTDIKKQYKTLLDQIRNHDYIELRKNLHIISHRPQLTFIALETIWALPNLKIRDWDIFWSSLIDRQYSFQIIHKLRSHVRNREDAQYVLELFTKHVDAFINPAFDESRSDYAIQTLIDIFAQYPDLADKAYSFTEKYLNEKRIDYHDLDDAGERQDKTEIAKFMYSLFNYYLETSDETKIASIITLANRHFSLVEDDNEYSLYTPTSIFMLLRDYIQKDFEHNFTKVIQLIIDQYKSPRQYGADFNGWDQMGGSFSQSGSDFQITDRHYLSYTLIPALKEYYLTNPNDCWQLIQTFIARNKGEVTAERPDFLGRLSIPILLNEITKPAHKEEVMAILKDQILMKKGIPSKHELIFYELRSREDISVGDKWKITKFYLDEYQLPYSVFVEQVVSDLAVKEIPDALLTLQAWMQNPEYRKLQKRHAFFVGQSMFTLLNAPSETKSFSTGVEILKYYLTTDEYKNDLDAFDSYDVSGAVTKIIEKQYSIGLLVLTSLYDSTPTLTTNQQVAIWLSIEQTNKDKKDLLKKIYDDFIEPVIITELQSDNQRIEQRFPSHYARELIIRFGEHLAKAGFMNEALALVKIFINDTNPTTENDTSDPEGKFNYHTRIKNGEDENTISTVRGWSAWALSAFISMRGIGYLTEIVGLVEQLTKDANLYVRTQATIPLAALCQNHHSVLPGEKKRFMGRKLADRIEAIAFNMMDDNSTLPVLLKHIEASMHRINTMSTTRAKKVFKVYGVYDFEPKTEDIYTLLAYFAIFRKNNYKAEMFEWLFGKVKFKQINSFDDRPFIELLESSIRNGNDKIRTQIAWYFWTLPKKNRKEFDDLFQCSYDYFNIIVEKYSKEAFSRLGYFIGDNVKEKPDQCIDLWERANLKERDWLIEHSTSMQPHEWWSHHNHGKLLEEVRKRYGSEHYMDDLDVLASYPKDFQPMFGPNDTYITLMKINNQRSKLLIQRLESIYEHLNALNTDKNEQ